MLVAAFFEFRQFGADDQVLDRDFAFGLLVGALNDDARRIAAVGIFYLRGEFAGAEIKLGANARAAQRRHHALIVGDAILVEDSDDDRAALGLGFNLANLFQRRGQARHADGKSRRRHRLAAKARDEAVVTSTAADRAEARRAVFAVGRECQFNFEHRAGVIFETANDARIEADAIRAVIRGPHQGADLLEFGDALFAGRAQPGRFAPIVQGALDVAAAIGERCFDIAENTLALFGVKAGTAREVAAVILAAFTEQECNAGAAEPVVFVDGAQHGEALAGVGLAGKPDAVEYAVEHFAVIHLHNVAAARNAERFDGVGRHHAHFRIGRRRSRTDGVGIELHELAEAARARLFVAIDMADAIAAIGFRQRVEILGDITGERRGQIVAQRQPLLVVVEKGEHALIGTILVGQEFAERVGIFKGRRLDRLEAVELIDRTNLLDHRAGRCDLARRAVFEAPGQPRLELVGLFGFVGHFSVNVSICAVRSRRRGGSSQAP